MAGLGNTAPCGCHQGAWWGVQPPPMCPAHQAQRTTTCAPPTLGTFVSAGTTSALWPASRLSDDDVERIARRVVELLGEVK